MSQFRELVYKKIMANAAILANNDNRLPSYLRSIGDFYQAPAHTQNLALEYEVPMISGAINKAIHYKQEMRSEKEVMTMLDDIVLDSIAQALKITQIDDDPNKNLLVLLLWDNARQTGVFGL